MDPNQKSKAGYDLEVWLAFSTELEKIAAMGGMKPTTVGEVRKAVSSEGTALMRRKPNYAKVNKGTMPPASSADMVDGPKSVQPPPVSM